MIGNSPSTSITGKAVGGMLGAAYGDALGWPNERPRNSEFAVPPDNNLKTLQKWTRRSGGRFFPFKESMDKGSYSDDTQLILSLARSLLHGNMWYDYFIYVELPFWTLYERGGGGATKRAACSWSAGKAPWQAKKAQDVKRYFNAGGNGVAMRILPHIIRQANATDFSPIALNIFNDGIITHGHPRALQGALAYGYALWTGIRKKGQLGYGELIETLILNINDWCCLPEPGQIPKNWFDKANEVRPDYPALWETVTSEIIDFMNICRDEINKGALGNDDQVLKDLQCFNRQISGAGTVACAAAVYLGSRHAAAPVNGVVKAAYATGSDTDTIASMTGGLLGVVNGTDWLSPLKNDIQDALYIEKTALELCSEQNKPFTDANPLKRSALNNWLQNLMNQPEGTIARLPDSREAKIKILQDHIGANGKYKVKKRKMVTLDGQSIFINKISKGNFADKQPENLQSAHVLVPDPKPVRQTGEMLIYRTEDGQIKLDVRLKDETIWLTQQMIAELFRVTIPNVSMHIKNVYDEGELAPEATVQKFLTVQKEGAREVRRNLTYYNLDMIISVGYRIKSLIATRFRIWATRQIKEYIIKGFVMDDERLQNPIVKDSAVPDYFDEMLARIRDIRASERRMYLRVKEIFAMAGDYDPSWGETTRFFSIIQNKLHYAATGMTAAELIRLRADAQQPNMGLTNWQKTEVRKADITIAKNYLRENEIDNLNRIVSMWLDFAEDQATRRKQFFMKDWELKLDEFLKFNDRKILINSGKTTHQDAVRHAGEEYDKFATARRKTKELTGQKDSIKHLEALSKKRFK